jgi:hypothetical protein
MKSLNFAIIFLITTLLITMGCAAKSPLITAASKGDSSTAQKLIKEGSNINDTDSNGATPLMYAIWSGKLETAKTLLNMGADANAFDKTGKTALIYASEQGYIEILKILLGKGANINKKDNPGNDALFHATYNNHNNAAKLLFLASKTMDKGGIQEVNKICTDFREDILQGDHHPYETYLNYRYLNPKISYRGNKKISIIVRDQRPYVLSKEKGAGYVGLIRERGLIRPYIYDIGTLSRKPLADDFTYCVAVAFNDVGFATENDFDQNQSKSIFTNKKPASANVDRIILIYIQEWMTDAFGYKTGLYYDVTLKIFDAKNTLLATTQVKGEDDLGGVSSESMYERVPTATKNILSKMLNSPDIQSALKN